MVHVQEMPTTTVVVPSNSPDGVLESLRKSEPIPIIARAGAEGVILDPRTIGADEFAAIGTAFSRLA